MGPALIQAAAAANCFVIPRMPDLPFDPFISRLYTPDELFDKFDPERPESHRMCRDVPRNAARFRNRCQPFSLANVDLKVLETLVARSVAETKHRYPQPD